MQPATWLLGWRICHHITREMRESLVIPFPSNLTWPEADPHLPKRLPMLQNDSCHGKGGCPCPPLERRDLQAWISPMFSTSIEKVPDHVACLGSRCRHTWTRWCCLCSVFRHSLPVAVYRTSYSHFSSGLWISLSQTTESTKSKSGSSRKLSKLYKIHVLNWKCTDNVLSTHAHFWKEITELTGNKDYSY